MLRNLFAPLEHVAPNLTHVALLQGTKAYGVHVRPLAVPARENRSEMHEQPNFYWNQERYLRAQQAGKAWHWSILRPVLIVGDSVGSAMNVIPALGAYAAMMRRAGKANLDYPGGVGRVAQAVDADLLAHAIAWSGEAERARNEIFSVSNGDVFMWPNVWPAIADALGFRAGEHVPLALDKGIRPREAEWAEICAQHGLRSGTLKEFVGLSFEYADYTIGHGRNMPGPAAMVSPVELADAPEAEGLVQVLRRQVVGIDVGDHLAKALRRAGLDQGRQQQPPEAGMQMIRMHVDRVLDRIAVGRTLAERHRHSPRRRRRVRPPGAAAGV